jgi:hypothetical protein
MRMLLDILRANLPHPVGAQVALVSNHVWQWLGVWFFSPARRTGEGFRSGNNRKLARYGIMVIFPGRAPVVRGSRNSACKYLLTYQDYLDIRREAPPFVTHPRPH